MEKTKVEAAVVGAGPLGMMAALALQPHIQQQGSDHSPSLLLIGPEAPHDGRTTAIMQQGISLLERLGLWPMLAQAAAPLKTMRIVDATKRLIRAPEVRFDASELSLECFGYNICNTTLNAALAHAIEHQPHIRWIKQTVDAAHFDQDTPARLVLANGAPVDASLVIAADGRNSFIRRAIAIESKHWSYPQIALVMNLAHQHDHKDCSTEFHTESGPFTLVPLRGRHSSLVWVVDQAEADGLRAHSLQDLANLISKKSHYLLGEVEITTPPMAYPLAGMIAHDFGKGPVVLIGETAHAFPPIGAQGMNLGIRDILALEKSLKNHPLTSPGEREKLSAAYATSRTLDVRLRTRAVDSLNRSLLTDFLPVHLGRGLGLYAMNSLPSLRKFVMKQGLGV